MAKRMNKINMQNKRLNKILRWIFPQAKNIHAVEKFVLFLNNSHALKKYLSQTNTEYLNHMFQSDKPSEWINLWRTWSATEEGASYWCEKHTAWVHEVYIHNLDKK